QVAFLRYGLGLVFMLPFFLQLTLVDIRSARLSLHATRGIIHSIGVMCWFYAMSRIPIADVTAIGFTGPVFATIGAALFLGERVRIRRILAVLIGLLGAIIILRPGFAEIELGALLMLVAAPVFAASDLLSKVLTRKESPPALVAYLSVFVTLVIMGPALYVWQWPTLNEWAWMFLTAGLATIGHLCMIKGVKVAELSALQPIKFLQLFWAALIGFFVFSEAPAIWTWLGSAVIIGSATYIAHRESVANKQNDC
ncbi:MAG: DMT family transporter, partial [Rhodospirillaceae bacterium]|nr:DMT family transporter [Rhodospirillaceae bacterium]